MINMIIHFLSSRSTKKVLPKQQNFLIDVSNISHPQDLKACMVCVPAQKSQRAEFTNIGQTSLKESKSDVISLIFQPTRTFV